MIELFWLRSFWRGITSKFIFNMHRWTFYQAGQLIGYLISVICLIGLALYFSTIFTTINLDTILAVFK